MLVRPAILVTLLWLSLLTAACGSHATPLRTSTSSQTPERTASATHSAVPSSTGSARLVVATAAWHLPVALSREVAFGFGAGLLVAGGLTRTGTSSTAILSIDPHTGSIRSWGRLAEPTHDAAGAVIGGTPFVFGGGSALSTASVQRLRAGATASLVGALPRRRSDLAATTVRGEALILGGYDDTTWDPSVLRTADGTTFDRVSSLPVPVRYAAVASTGDVVWTFGGQTMNGASRAIQRIDGRTGRAITAGRLPYAVSDAAAVPLGADIYICGGLVGGRPSDRVLAFDPVSGSTRSVARLPHAVSDAAVVIVDATAYLLGGETPEQTDSVTTLRLVGAGS